MFLTACGDSDGASANNGSATLEDVYASEDDLPGCTEKYDGAVAFVKDGYAAFKCEDGRWENKGEYYANNDAIKNCTSKREGEIAYIVDEDKSLVCQDGKWVNSSNVSSSSSWSEAIGSCSSKVPEPAEGTSSSDVSSSSVVSSSSSVTPQSSSSETSVSSNSTKSSSSVVPSSSSVASSSSVQSSSSSAQSSSSLGWSWDVPKEAYLNPEITYGTMTDSRDGKIYKTVKIGGQVWMAENLNYDPGQGGSGENKYEWSWCYKNEPKNCDVAGRLYTWAAAIDSVKLANDADNPQDCGYNKTCDLASAGSATLVQGICPSGWHLPTKVEFDTLFAAVGGRSNAGMVLKSQTGWKDNSTDAFGFSALPAGYVSLLGGSVVCSRSSSDAYFWSSTELNRRDAIPMHLQYDVDTAFLNNILYKNNGSSVRCVKD